MKTVADVCKFIGGVIHRPPICIETGCMYVVNKENLVHTTTNNIAKYVCQKDGMLFSLDIDPEHVETAKSITGDKRVWFVEGDSVASLERMARNFNLKSVDLLWLDSKEFDSDHMVREYDAIKGRLRKDHFVLIDDIHNPGSVKWKGLVPLLKDFGYDYMEISTPTGLFIAARGYNLPEE